MRPCVAAQGFSARGMPKGGADTQFVRQRVRVALSVETDFGEVEELFADIVVPVSRGPFTFSIDGSDPPSPGTGVAVRLGRGRIYMGIVWRVHDERPAFPTKPVERVMTQGAILTPRQMELWEWVARYYMCTLGDVMRFAMPAALKPSGRSEDEFARDEYRPATVRYVAFGDAVPDCAGLNAALDGLKRSRAQASAVHGFLARFEGEEAFAGEMPAAELGVSAQVLSRLAEKGIFRIYEKETVGGAVVPFDPAAVSLAELSDVQRRALDGVNEQFAERGCVLLHGVTGSGKTEIYMHMIADELAGGRSVLYMMPEIAMTSQLVERIRAVFGERVVVYHSKLGDRMRAEVYRRLLASEGGELIVGVRSSIFLPLPRLGLVIVDEEHDQSYKQAEPAPRYNARDCAVWMSSRWEAHCLLASATPSIESYVNARGGKYGFVRLDERYGEGRLPAVVISDSLRALKRGERKFHFDKALSDRMCRTLAEGRQVMLFQNRRGFAPWIECSQCGWVARCPRCSVTLTYHKKGDRLVCHMCGYAGRLPLVCPECGTPAPAMKGFGTEKVEEDVSAMFPEARVSRLDRDTASSPGRYERIVSEFARGETDVLVGTQMITKGFDFPRLGLVGILNADNLLNYPDFRASERAFQTMTQVVGRAGRSDGGGQAVIQTMQPDHPVIRQVQTADYTGMVDTQLAERSVFGYPPYGKLITVTLRHRDPVFVEQAASWLAAGMRRMFGDRVYGPHTPVVEKIGDENYFEILLKIENGRSFAAAKETLTALLETFSAHKEYRKVFVYCDVDPQ